MPSLIASAIKWTSSSTILPKLPFRSASSSPALTPTSSVEKLPLPTDHLYYEPTAPSPMLSVTTSMLGEISGFQISRLASFYTIHSQVRYLYSQQSLYFMDDEFVIFIRNEKDEDVKVQGEKDWRKFIKKNPNLNTLLISVVPLSMY